MIRFLSCFKHKSNSTTEPRCRYEPSHYRV